MLISRDTKTIPTFANERVAAGQAVPGVFLLSAAVSMAEAIDDLALNAEATNAGERIDRVVYLPLR